VSRAAIRSCQGMPSRQSTAPRGSGLTRGGDARLRVLVAGGGIAAIEALLALRALAGHLISVTLLAPEAELVYRPVTVAEAFGRAEASAFQIADILDDQHSEHVQDSLEHVDLQGRAVVARSGARIPYDVLVIAVGAHARAPLPGALTFGGRADVPRLRALMEELVSGVARSVAFTLAREQVWALPLYELALMTADHLREHASGARVVVVTPEEEPLELFGPDAARALSPMLAALGVTVRCSSIPALVARRELVLAGGGVISADRVVTLPLAEGPCLSGLPADRHGFIPVDSHGRVTGLSDVYAAGDITAFPLKQGGLAAQQADAVAEAIAAAAGAPLAPRPFQPVLRGLLLTAGAPVYLRCEPHRLSRQTSVAIDAPRPRHHEPAASAVSNQPLWWPPAKIAGRYLAPYLATARPVPLTSEPLRDRFAVSGPSPPGTERRDALELALLLADGDARWGDYLSALSALDAAEALEGALPPEYQTKRDIWMAEVAQRP
jgi:sulfide:quinone oxidoreductase